MQNKWFWVAGVGLLLVALIGAFLGGGEEPKKQKRETASPDTNTNSQLTKEEFAPLGTKGARTGEGVTGTAPVSEEKSDEAAWKKENSKSISKEPKSKMVIKWKVPKKNKQEKPVWKPIKKEEPPKPKGIPEGGTIW